jgi:hypothetical protein
MQMRDIAIPPWSLRDHARLRGWWRLVQLANGRWLQIDAYAEWGQITDSLVDTRRDPGLAQTERQGQTGNSAADDDHLHGIDQSLVGESVDSPSAQLWPETVEIISGLLVPWKLYFITWL